MKSIVYLTHVIIGFTVMPLLAYVAYLVGRAFIHTCNVISSTYSFLVYGDYTSQLSYFNSEYKVYEIVNNLIWFPDLPLEGVNKIGEFLQYSFFSRDDAFNVFIYSVCALIFLSILSFIASERTELEISLDNSTGYFIGVGISILCFYPAWCIVTFMPLFSLVL